MSEKCIAQVKDAAKSNWQKTVYRSCLMNAVEDGYCNIHHPERVARAIEDKAFSEVRESVREGQRIEEAAVGAFLRLRQPVVFASLLGDIRASRDIQHWRLHQPTEDIGALFAPKPSEAGP